MAAAHGAGNTPVVAQMSPSVARSQELCQPRKIHLGRNKAEVGYGSAKQKYGARYERGMNKRASGIFQKLPQPSPNAHVAVHGV